MKDLVVYITEETLEDLSKFIIDNIEGKTIEQKYNKAINILQNNKNNVDKNYSFESIFDEFCEKKYISDIMYSSFRKLNSENKDLILNAMVAYNPDSKSDSNSKNNTKLLDINDIFSDNVTFYSNLENIFVKISNKLTGPSDSNIDKNLRDVLCNVSKLKAKNNGKTTCGRFENLLEFFINDNVSRNNEDGDVVLIHSQIEVKYCDGCNFSHYGTKTILNKTEFLNKFKDKEEEKAIIKTMTNIIANHYYVDSKNDEYKYINRFVKNFFEKSKNVNYKKDNYKLFSCFGTYMLHNYLLTQFNDKDNEYLIFFVQYDSMSNAKYGNYIWINAKQYKDEYNKNPDNSINDLIEFSQKNLEFFTINRNTIEVRFKK
jgi:hypothetical protein